MDRERFMSAEPFPARWGVMESQRGSPTCEAQRCPAVALRRAAVDVSGVKTRLGASPLYRLVGRCLAKAERVLFLQEHQ